MRLVLLIVALVLLVAVPAEARAWSPNVQHARTYARAHVNRGQWRCLHVLWMKESHWSVHGTTPAHASPRRAAYGIPQAFPGRKMRSAGSDWRTNGTTQVRWGLAYIRGRYGTPCHARRFQARFGWY